MAAYNVWFTKEPGRYTPPQTVGWTVSDNVNYFTLSQGDTPAAIAEYIAYDQLTPPNPFIAVTQDGTGNVVYDGGFPKFYNVNGPAAGINSSITMEFKATCQGVAAGVNAYYYNAFTDLQCLIAAGDKLVFDMIQDSANARVGIDAVTNYDPNIAAQAPFYSLRDWSTGGIIKDQNGVAIHPATNLGTRAVGQWYHREFDLTPCAGYTFIKWSMAYEGETAGTFATRFRDVYILDSTGKIKYTLFKDTMKLPGNTSAEAGASGYTNLSKSLYDPRSQLSASFKYLFNAFNWCANPAKVTAGNRKILILGDVTSGGNYAVKSTGDSGFLTSMTNLCAAAGFTPTFKDTSDYSGGKLGCTLAELADYALVLMISTAYDANNAELITPAAVSALTTFRSQGNGLIFITDHGSSVMTTVEQAKTINAASSGFYGTANRVIVNFGCWFTGNYDRTPVNVGFIRSTYGDHPLYAGMADSESIAAGGSESKIQITPYTKYTKASPPANLQFNADGRYIVQVTAKLKDGNAESFRVAFIMGTGALLKWQVTAGGAELTDTFTIGYANHYEPTLFMDTLGLGTLVGSVYLNDVKVGVLSSDDTNGGKMTLWLDNLFDMRWKHGDVLKAALESPIQYTATYTALQISVLGNAHLDTAPLLKQLTAAGAAKSLSTVARHMAAMVPKGSVAAGKTSPFLPGRSEAEWVKLIRDFSKQTFNLSTRNVMVFTADKIAAALTGTGLLAEASYFGQFGRQVVDTWYPPLSAAPPSSRDDYWWSYDTNANSMTYASANNGRYQAMLSRETVEDYTFSGYMASATSDTGVIIFVIAAKMLDVMNTLSFVVGPLVGAQLWYNYGRPEAKLLKQGVAALGGTWAGNSLKFTVTRRGGWVAVDMGDWYGSDEIGANRILFFMNEEPLMVELLGPARYGFAVKGVGNPKWTSLRRRGMASWGVMYDVAGNMYRWDGSKFALVSGANAKVALGTSRQLNNLQNGQTFQIDANGVITKLTDPAGMLLAPLSNSKFINPVTGAVLSPQTKVYSPTYGWQSLPANLTMTYYFEMYLPAGTYIFIGAADDNCLFEIDGVGGYKDLGGGYSEGQAVSYFEVTFAKSQTHAFKVKNTNVPANTPGYMYFMILRKADGSIFYEPMAGDGVIRTNDVIGTTS